jgi:hypothetical protein
MENGKLKKLDFASLIFIAGAFWAVSARLEATRWNENIYRVEYLVILGILMGILIAISRFSNKNMILIASGYSIIVIMWQLGLTLGEDLELAERIISLNGRLVLSLREFLGRKPVKDPILFLLLINIILWGSSIITGYRLMKNKSPWIPILIMGITVLSVEFYSYHQARAHIFSAIFLYFIILLAGRRYYINAKTGWQDTGVLVDAEVGFEMGRSVAVGAFILILLGWNVPGFINGIDSRNPVPKRVQESWQGVREYLSNAFVSLNSPPILAVDVYQDTMLLGTGTELGDISVFDVEVTHRIPETLRFYWRARSYDKYENGEWGTTLNGRSEVDSDSLPILYPDWQGRKLVTFSIDLNAPLTGMLFAPAMPVSLSRPVTMIYNQASDGTNDIAGLLLDPPLRGGESYKVRSWVSHPTIVQLQMTPSDYPEWVTEQYLQVPEELSEQLATLVDQITEYDQTAYEKTMAVTNFLRSEIEYQEIIITPPENEDPIEWFLFYYRKGFCNYYATAEVLMLRSIGIPARLAMGYSQGVYVEQPTSNDTNEYSVYQRDSHAWPEVYFSEIGWVEFEPTTSQPETTFIPGEDESILSNERDDEISENQPGGISMEDGDDRLDDIIDVDIPTDEARRNAWDGWLFFIIAVAIVGFYFWNRMRAGNSKNLSIPLIISRSIENRGFEPPKWLDKIVRYSSCMPLEKYFVDISIIIWLFRLGDGKARTPSENVAYLSSMIPKLTEPATNLLREYELDIFSPYPGDLKAAKAAVKRMRKLSLRILVGKIFEI